ncbi:MAG: hypothetical protein A2176_15280 [Spirochaetes bacterium RBG_13_51_14]|nr:MAG: hypothetical protein A2176_15280 [Spirochaetes bacterium RBG_13_51_14]
MLTKYDEFLCHQTVDTFDSVATSAREWTERIWFSAHDTEGKRQLVAGFGHYPNRNVMDAYACFVVEGKTQYCVRASRELRPAIDEVRVGPFSYEVIEPLALVRLSLGDNEYGLRFRIDFRGAMPPHEEEAQFAKSRGRVLENIKRYVQVGRPSGWINAGGAMFRIDELVWRAERDHSWGIRRGGGVPETGVQPGEVPRGYLYNFMLAQFDSWGVTYHVREDWDASLLSFSGAMMYPPDAGQPERRIASVDHQYTFKQDIRHISGGTVVFHTDGGEPIEVAVRPLSTCYIRAGGYFGFRGFTHGLWLGGYYIDGFTLDLTDSNTLKEVSFIEDFMCEMRCGSEVGYGIVEMVVIGTYPKYGYLSY